MAYIYKIINDKNNKIYIGQTVKKIQYRLQEHFHKAEWDYSNHKKLTHLSQAIITHGKEHFHIELIEECDLLSVDERERYWIAYYDSYNNGYNMTIGGQDLPLNKGKPILQYSLEGQYIQTFDSALQAAYAVNLHDNTIRRACRQQVPAGQYQWRYFSADYPLQIPPMKHNLYKNKQKIKQYNLKGELINCFNSINEASKNTGISTGSISRACHIEGVSKAGGFQWRFEESEDIPINIEKPKKEPKIYKTQLPTIQYSKEYDFIKEWDTIKEAAETLNIRSSSIINVCENKQNTTGGYYWRYKKLTSK